MEKYLRQNFVLESKRPSSEALRRWRSAVSMVKNPRRRFRLVADLAKRDEAERKRRKLQEKVRIAIYVKKAALQFFGGIVDNTPGKESHYKLSKEVRDAGFGIEPDKLASIVGSRDTKDLEHHGGVQGLARELSVSLDHGVVSSDVSVRQNIYGLNRYVEKPSRSFWMFVWEALQDYTLVILIICAAISVGVGTATEGWPKGMYDVLGMILCIFLVVIVKAVGDYNQSLQFKDLDKEKKNIIVQVTRDGCRQKVSIYDLVVGDVVHPSNGDQVPGDGVFISGSSLSIDESSLTGESEPVNVHQERPLLLSGTKVQEGVLSSPFQDLSDRMDSEIGMEWNFQNLDSLKKFSIGGKCEVAESFPPPGLRLPTGLMELHLYDFPYLAYLDRNGFQQLTSLKILKIWSCPMLKAMPEGGLPTSVHYLEIRNCPLLKERLEMRQGNEWDKIAPVEVIMIDDEWIH